MHAASYKVHTVLSENIRPGIYSHQLKRASNLYMLPGTNRELSTYSFLLERHHHTVVLATTDCHLKEHFPRKLHTK